MEHPRATLQYTFTEAAQAQAGELRIPLHLESPRGAPVPQVGDIVGVARADPRSRFVVASREFIWDREVHDGRGPQVLLVLDALAPGL